MNEKTLQTLEYFKIIEKLTNKAISPMGKEKCKNLTPSLNIEEIKLIQKETTEATSMILKRGSLPLGGIKDISQSIKRVNIGGVLSIEELLYIGDFLYVSRKVSGYGKEEDKNENLNIINNLFSQISHASNLEKEINRCIVSQTEVSDDASDGLYHIRKNIKSSNDRIKEQLNKIIHSSTYKNMLQDSVITIRNERFCVPIKQEYRNSFPGMIHDQSSTGATLFIEPMSVVQLNNKIKELLAQEKAEIEKILRSLSLIVAENSDLLISNQEILTSLDFIFAKGELSISMFGTEPIFNTNGIINIKAGRHPLLDPKTVVPINIYLGKDFNTLLITGPNTGGKTVSLKTLGLFTLMGQAGLHISAFDNSQLAVFEHVYADIGDEQSIEQSLSTFSSHMSNIVKILSNVTNNSLVLLDELGAGTDPTEGAALAISIIQYLYNIKVRTAVTTHYSELKVYALSTEGVENASCEFDLETLKPTYKLLIGVPGKSNAFAISQKLGLPEHIISSAKELISHQDARFEDVITDLEISKKTVLIEKERAEQYRKEAERLKSDFENQKQKLSNQREKIIYEAKEEARKIMQDTKDSADRLIKELQKQIRDSSNNKEIESTRQTIRDKLSSLEKDAFTYSKQSDTLRSIPKNLRKGDRVFIHTLNQRGIVTSSVEQNGEVMIQAGIMKVKVHISNLSIDNSEETVKFNSKSISQSVKSSKSKNISPEIDLRGHMVNEALEKTDKYLDDAYLSALAQVTVIHGKGTGALRNAIHLHLKNHPHIKSYRLGTYGEGETGVTIVEFNK